MKKFLIDDGICVEYYTSAHFREVATPEIIFKITQATSNGFGIPRNKEDMRSHIFGAENIGIVHKYGVLAGFATTQNFPEMDLCYLHGIAIGSTGVGTGSSLLQCMFLESGANRFGFTTQNPLMYLSAKKIVVQIFPNPDTEPDTETVGFGKKLVAHRSGYFLRTMAIKGLYTECLYPAIPIPKDDSLWRWWQQMLQIDSDGKSRDGIVFVGKIK